MFSAYTVKKIVPRLLIAAVMIQLSWWIVIEIININNNIAHGIEGLMYAPFGGIDNFLSLGSIIQSAGSSGTFVATGVFTAVAAGTAFIAAGSGSIVGILALAATAALGLLIAIFTLVLRQAVLLFLVIISPVAIVAWVLPGTERFWKLWWETFSKLLIIYPMILMAIAAGRIFAYVSANSNQNQFLGFILVVLGFFGPLFMIPAMLKLAGSVFATISGVVNNRGKGAFDRLRNVRANEAKKNFEKTKAGSRFSENNMMGRRFNRISAGASVGARGGFGLGRRGREALDLHGQSAADDALKNNPALQKLAFNDDGNAVMALGGTSRSNAELASRQLMQGWLRDSREYMEAVNNNDVDSQRRIEAEMENRRRNAVSAASAVGFNRANAQAALTTMAQNKSRAVGAGDGQIIADGIERLAGGNTTMAENLAGNFQYHSRGAGRFDLGAGTAEAGVARGSLYQLANAHASTIHGWGEDIARGLGTAEGDHRATIAYQELRAMLPNSTGETRDAIVQQMDALEGNAAFMSYMQSDSGVIDPNTGAQQTINARVEYDAANPAHAAWSPEDIARGWRNQRRNQTRADLAQREARVYERPDPNHL